MNISATLHVNGQVLQCHAGSAKAAIGESLIILDSTDCIRIRTVYSSVIKSYYFVLTKLYHGYGMDTCILVRSIS